MYRIGIVSVYFGRLPNYIKFWMKSAEYNPDIDFFIVNDGTPIEHPDNVHFIKMNLSQFSELATKKVGLPIDIKEPYKCCDFKVAYGLILEDYLKSYDFWGHCDLDLVWGRLRDFLTDDLLTNYDRIYPLGHFSLYRNVPEINKSFMLSGSEKGSYDEIFTSSKNYAFDELRGIYLIYKKHNIPQYDKYEFADISPVFHRFKVVTNYTNYDNNFKNQIFMWHDGRITRYYLDPNGNIKEDEYAYLHFQKRKYSDEQLNINEEKDFVISPQGFFNLNSQDINKRLIRKYNKYYGALYEWFEWKKRNF